VRGLMADARTEPRLAILGGEPAFPEPLHVGQPNLGNRAELMTRIEDMLDRRWLTNRGPFVEEFEQRVADLLDVPHCVAMCNGTIALEVATKALGMTGEVIVPSFTFVATAHALQWQAVTPVFCDIDPATHNIDPARVEELITPRTTGIIGVHVWGRPCAVEALAEIAARRNLRLMYDSAHAFDCAHEGRMIGSFGDAEVFSFHATKFFNTFEGGAVVTHNDELAEKIRLMTNFGFADYDKVVYLGTNAKMPEMSAAMGLTMLGSLDEIVVANRRNHQCYRDCLADIPGVSLTTYREDERRNCQYCVAEIDTEQTGLTRDELVRVLHAENVLARRYFYPGCHRMEPYRSYYPHAGLLLPQTEKLCDSVLILPTGTGIVPKQIETICGLLAAAVSYATDVREALRS
jgi:dTDP-4-amino-4,6-dideoxygalactose transaminase